MSTTIVYADGTKEVFARVKLKDGFAHCYEKADSSLDSDGFESKLVYFMTLLLWVSLMMWQPTHYKAKSVPESQIEEVK
jgi:hypothetical protein